MTDQSTSNSPGWYLDPAVQGQLRFWDGEHWTRDVRPTVVESAPADHSTTDLVVSEFDAVQPQRNYATVVLGLLIVFFAAGGFYEVVSGGTSGGTNPNAFATPTTIAQQAPPNPSVSTIPTDSVTCADAARRPSARGVVRLLVAKGLPITAADRPVANEPTTAPAGPTPAAPAAGAGPSGTAVPPPLGEPCTQAGFIDQRATATNTIAVFPTPSGAATAAARPAPIGFVSVQVGTVVIELQQSLAPYNAAYREALQALGQTIQPS